MSALGTISIKTKDGVYKNYTLSINDDTNEYGQNLKMYEEQKNLIEQDMAPFGFVDDGVHDPEEDEEAVDEYGTRWFPATRKGQ